MNASSLSQNQRLSFAWVACERAAGKWARARRAGERVTLSSLYRRGLLVRRPWRGEEGAADAAYEYNFAPVVVEALAEKVREAAALKERPGFLNSPGPSERK